jgi:hypothetical protein
MYGLQILLRGPAHPRKTKVRNIDGKRNNCLEEKPGFVADVEGIHLSLYWGEFLTLELLLQYKGKKHAESSLEYPTAVSHAR